MKIYIIIIIIIIGQFFMICSGSRVPKGGIMFIAQM